MLRAAILVSCALVTTAAAGNSWHAGLDLRADLGTHPIRAGGGIHTGTLDTTLILDQMFGTDGQHDMDLFATYSVADGGWGPLAGWRVSTIGIEGGTQLQQKLLLGVAAQLPSVWNLRIAPRIPRASTRTTSMPSG